MSYIIQTIIYCTVQQNIRYKKRQESHNTIYNTMIKRMMDDAHIIHYAHTVLLGHTTTQWNYYYVVNWHCVAVCSLSRLLSLFLFLALSLSHTLARSLARSLALPFTCCGEFRNHFISVFISLRAQEQRLLVCLLREDLPSCSSREIAVLFWTSGNSAFP